MYWVISVTKMAQVELRSGRVEARAHDAEAVGVLRTRLNLQPRGRAPRLTLVHFSAQ
jgi:hypothetical protein